MTCVTRVTGVPFLGRMVLRYAVPDRLAADGCKTGRTSPYAGRPQHPGGAPVTRRTMNDVADGLLLDVREISITDLEFTDSDSALSQALERILASRPERSFAGFNNFIS